MSRSKIFCKIVIHVRFASLKNMMYVVNLTRLFFLIFLYVVIIFCLFLLFLSLLQQRIKLLRFLSLLLCCSFLYFLLFIFLTTHVSRRFFSLPRSFFTSTNKSFLRDNILSSLEIYYSWICTFSKTKYKLLRKLFYMKWKLFKLIKRHKNRVAQLLMNLLFANELFTARWRQERGSPAKQERREFKYCSLSLRRKFKYAVLPARRHFIRAARQARHI